MFVGHCNQVQILVYIIIRMLPGFPRGSFIQREHGGIVV